MAIYWTQMRDFVLLNLGRLSAQSGGARCRSSMSKPEPVPASLKASWHEPYEEAAIGYEASWVGVFQNPVK